MRERVIMLCDSERRWRCLDEAVRRLTVKVAGVVLRLQLGNELSFLPQQAVPVQLCEERVLLHLKGTSCGDEGGDGGAGEGGEQRGPK